MENLEQMLISLQREVDKTAHKKEEARLRGETFNVFNILGLSSNETRAHSAFLAELLNPNGSHGCRGLFLKEFLRISSLENFGFDENNAKVEIERSIGYKNNDATEGGRLDIVLESNDRMIIIENKIYAADQEKQLIRYKNYTEREKEQGHIKKATILYLTLDGHEASSFSVGDGIEYTCISYSNEIIEWLKACVSVAVQKPLVRESLIQYSNLIKQLTNQDMDTNDEKRMFDILSKYPDVAAELYHIGFTKYLEYVFEKYVTPRLKDFANKQGLQYEECHLWDGQDEKAIYFYRPEWKHYTIIITNENKNHFHDFFIGISSRNEISEDMLIPSSSKLDCFNSKGNKWWPYGYSYLPKYASWWANITINMVNGDFADYIVKEVHSILEELKYKDILLK